MATSEPKNHHYIPRCLLKHFVDEDGRLWLQEWGKPEIHWNWPKQAFKQKHLYRTVDLLQTRDFSHPDYSVEVEHILGELEDRASPIIQTIIEIARNKRHPVFPLTQEQTDIVKQFIHAMLRRTPEATEEFLEDGDGYEADFRDATNTLCRQRGLESFGREVFVQPDVAERMSVARQNSGATYAAGTHRVMQDDGRRICRMAGLHIYVAFTTGSPRSSFVIGSRGVTAYQDRQGHKSAWLPVAPHVAIGLTNVPGEIWVSLHGPTGNFVEELNRCTAKQSKTIAGHAQALIRAIVRKR